MNTEEIEKEFQKYLYNVKIFIQENKEPMISGSEYRIIVTDKNNNYVGCDLLDEALNDKRIKNKYIQHTCEEIAMQLGKIKYLIK